MKGRQTRQNPAKQEITSEELAQGPYVAARDSWVEPATFRTEGTEQDI